jgi:hypothetical protein
MKGLTTGLKAIGGVIAIVVIVLALGFFVAVLCRVFVIGYNLF